MKAALRSYLSSLGWLMATMARISGRQPGAFVLATILMGVLRVMQFLVMVLPLKVVLLAASEGVPSYAPFIDPSDKGSWIIGLAAGTIVAYFFAQFLDSFAKRICQKAGAELMAQATVLNVVPNQREAARNIFSDLASVLADALFWTAGMVLYAVIAPPTFAAYLGLVIFSLLLGTLFAIGKGRRGLDGANRLITENLQAYLSTNSTLIFFACFIVILYPYVAGIPINMLIGLISIILLRRTLGALVDSVRGAVKLIEKRHLVDTLMFLDRQFLPRQHQAHQKLAEVFSPAKRLALVRAMLAQAQPASEVKAVEWVDPAVPGLSTFLVTTSDKAAYHLQIYPPRHAHLPRNEDALFYIMPRSALGAPEVLAEQVHGGFTCRLVAAGTGRAVSASKWKKMLNDVLAGLGAVRPGDDVVGLYRTTHVFAYERLTSELIRRVRVAARDDAEKAAIRAFSRSIDALQERLARVPLYVSNKDLRPNCAVTAGKQGAMLMYWGNWSIDPIGGGAMARLRADHREAVFKSIIAQRPDAGADVTMADVELSSLVQNLVLHIDKGHYGAAIDLIVEIGVLQKAEGPAARSRKVKARPQPDFEDAEPAE